MKKRIIFKLYYKSDHFYLSRNFNLQKVGDYNWLFMNFNFKNIADYIDELVILNVENEKNEKTLNTKFKSNIKNLAKKTFIPITIGGGINSLYKVSECFELGAEKIIINSGIINTKLVNQLTKKFGSQAIICSIDYKEINNLLVSFLLNGNKKYLPLSNHIKLANKLNFGEIFLNDIDRDGTGFGLNNKIYKYLDKKIPYVVGGGAAKHEHFIEGFNKKNVTGISTGNLFNFIGDGLKNLRKQLILSHINIRRI